MSDDDVEDIPPDIPPEPAPPRAPRGLGTAGRKIWHDATRLLCFAPAELLVLEQVARIRDTIGDLSAIVKREGMIAASSQGARAHPALVELRQQQALYGRLITSLRIPTDVPEADDQW